MQDNQQEPDNRVEPGDQPDPDDRPEPTGRKELHGQSEPPSAMKWVKYAAVAGVAAVAVVWVANTWQNDVAPMLSTASAIGSLREEAAQRANASPMVIVPLLIDSMEDGTMAVEFAYRDTAGFGLNATGNVALSVIAEESASALEMDVNIGGFISLDFAAFLNRERLAMRTRLIDNNFYGITFDTFREDIAHFGGLMGMSRSEMDAMADGVELFAEMLRDTTDADEVAEPYVLIWRDFLGGLEAVAGESATGGTQLTYVITQEELVRLFNDILEQLEDDENLRPNLDLTDNMMMGMMAGAQEIDRLLETLREAVTGFEDDVRVSMYVTISSRNNRVYHLGVSGEIEALGDSGEYAVSLGLGESVFDPWVFDLEFAEEWGERSTLNAVWEFGADDGYAHTLAVTNNLGETAVLTSFWAPQDGGRFTLGVRENSFNQEVSGTLELDGVGGFRLVPDIPLGATQTLNLTITAAPGAVMPEIEYINLDQWDRDLLDMVEALMGLMNW
ncbi:MAG: hypothetical protein FWD98_03055 [Defluviitaleaceae bacterium]|nr:hypothetical protein [Defluviitaleaceae bacterium]